MNIVQPTAIPTITIGGRVFTDVTNLKHLQMIVSTTNGCSARTPGATSGYVVPANFQLRILAARIFVSTKGTNSLIVAFGYCDNDCGFPTATAPTNLVSGFGSRMFAGDDAAVDSQKEFITNFVIPAGKYTYFSGDGTTAFAGTFFGYLEAV